MKRFLIALLWAGLIPVVVQGRDTYPPVDVLLQTGKTIGGEDIVYPSGDPQVTVAIVTMTPGQVTGWHRHQAPLVAYILEGEISVDYGEAGQKTYQAGDALVEALGTPHSGTNTGEGIVRILVVFAGAEGAENTVAEE